MALTTEQQIKVRRHAARAVSAIKFDVEYELGRGGFNAKKLLPNWDDGKCDCTGFISWVLQLKRSRVGTWWHKWFKWIESSAIYRDANGKQRFFVKLDSAVIGCVAVYPDYNGKEGHAGIVRSVHPNGNAATVVDCRRGGFAVRPSKVFVLKNATYCVLRADL